MAATKTVTAPVIKDEDRVEVFIPRGNSGDDPNLYVSVNEYTALLPRGQKSLVPKFVADEIYRAMEAEDRFYKTSSEREIKE